MSVKASSLLAQLSTILGQILCQMHARAFVAYVDCAYTSRLKRNKI